jgi:hypothetical protein
LGRASEWRAWARRTNSPEDVEGIAAHVPNNSSAAVAWLEHDWATHLSEAIRRAHGRILDSGLVSADEVEALGIELAAQ